MRVNYIILLILLPFFGTSQQEYESQIFKSTRVVNGQSVEANDQGEMTFIISHRFGYLSQGAYELFGLDQSNMRMGLDYGLTNKLTIGAGRSSFQKTLDGFIKYKIIQQGKGENKTPVSITGLSAISINGLRFAEPERENFFTSRLSYAFQLLIARKFSDAFTWQLMPTLIHHNLVPTASIKHDVIAVGSATRWQISKMVSIQTEYYYVLPNQIGAEKRNSLSLGVDIETKGHVFQLHVSNSFGMIENYYITETKGNWSKGDIGIGFNITRDFRIRGRK